MFTKGCDSSDRAGLPSVTKLSAAEDKQPSEAGTQWALFSSGIGQGQGIRHGPVVLSLVLENLSLRQRPSMHSGCAGTTP